MKPIVIAKQLYADYVKDAAFEVKLAGYLQSSNGLVIDTPTYFVMAAAVEFEGKKAWYIDTAAGRLKDLIRLFPFPLPYIAFSRGKRDGKLHIYDTKRFLRLAK